MICVVLSVIPRDVGVAPGGRTRLLSPFCLVNYLVPITERCTMFSTEAFLTTAVYSILNEIFGFMTAKIIIYSTNIHSVKISNSTRESQMKTLKFFKNIIYCAEVVQSCFAFQNNLPHAQCKSSSAYKVHKFL